MAQKKSATPQTRKQDTLQQNVRSFLPALKEGNFGVRLETPADPAGRETAAAVNEVLELAQSALAAEHLRLQVQEERLADAKALARVVQDLADATTVDQAASVALNSVRGAFGLVYGSYWAVDPASRTLKFAVESGSVNEEFRRVTLSASFAEGVGLSGRAWRARDVVFVRDLGEVTDCVRAPVAQRAGVKSGICLPIVVKGEVAGTMDFFALETLNPSAERLEALRNVGRLVSGAIEQVRNAGVLRKRVDYVEREIARVVGDLTQIAAGDFNIDLNVSAHDADTRDLGESFTSVNHGLENTARAVHGFQAELEHLTAAAREGKLSERGRAERFQGAYADMVRGFNATLDAVIDPLRISARYVDRIGKGDLPEKIAEAWHGEFDDLRNNLNAAIDQLGGLIAEMRHMSDEHNKGDIDVAIPDTRFNGAYREMAQGVNGMVSGHIAVKKKAMACIAEFADGNFDAPLEQFPGKKAFINDNIERLRANVRQFILEMKHMSDEHNKGDIDVAIPADRFNGVYREMAQGVNGMVAGHITVKKKAMACIAEFANGNFDASLEQFPGKKAFINDNIERLRANIRQFIQEMNRMSDEHNKGDIDVSIPADRFAGAFRVMAQGVNDMVAGHITVKKKAMACIGEFGRGNFEAPLDRFPGKKAFINDTIEQVRTNLKSLITDMNQLAVAAVQGQLATRADAAQHGGDFRKIVDGVNRTLEAVIGPLNIAAQYVAQISTGDMPQKITETWNGDFNTIRNNLNVLVDSMNAITALAEDIARGNLKVKISERSPQDKLMRALADMVAGLTRVVVDIKSMASEVTTGSSALSMATTTVSQGASEQSASAEQASASMEEMVSNIRQNAENAHQTEKIAVKSAEDAREGGKSVNEAVGAMKEIASRISIIEEIARQTNMLALNAAIEAARAGEHGKGFAVVAAEVRKLAERSQKAAGEINQLSSSTVKLAERAGETLSLLVPNIQKTAELVQEISAASAEQNQGAEQINTALQQLQAVIQQNATASEEMAATSEELNGQAEQMVGTINFFDIGDSGAAARRPAPAAEPEPRARKPLAALSDAVSRGRTPARSTPAPAKKNGRHNGVALQLNGGDSTDEVFERY